jgi:hypothetical protein
MRTIIILSVMAVLLFAGAWVASSCLAKHFEEKAKEDHPGASANPETGREKESPTVARANETPAQPRPGNDAEQLGQELARLRELQEAVTRQEHQLTARRRALEIIKEDIRCEREEIEGIREELGDQVNGPH